MQLRGEAIWLQQRGGGIWLQQSGEVGELMKGGSMAPFFTPSLMAVSLQAEKRWEAVLGDLLKN